MQTAYKHQQEILDLNPKYHLLAWGTGSGKSLAALRLAKQNGSGPLIICPKSLQEQWWELIRAEGMLAMVWSKETFKKKIKQEHVCKYLGIIVDEAHYFFGQKSQMYKDLIAYIDYARPKYVYLLTATPYLSSSWNIFCAGKLLGKAWKWWDWNKKFFSQIKMGRRTIPIQKKTVDGMPIEKHMANIVNSIGNTVSLEDCFDVPYQIFEKELFDLTKEQSKAIDALDDFLPIVRFTKIHQICGGSLKGDGYTEDRFFKSEKLDRLIELIKDNNKMAVVCRYNNEIKYIKERIEECHHDKQVFVINGAVSNRHEVVQEIEKRDNCVALIQAACSEGYGLPSIPLMIFYSYDFSLKNYIQMLGRIQRAGHIKKNVYISLLVKDSIDYSIWDTVVNKKMDFQVEIYNK